MSQLSPFWGQVENVKPKSIVCTHKQKPKSNIVCRGNSFSWHCLDANAKDHVEVALDNLRGLHHSQASATSSF